MGKGSLLLVAVCLGLLTALWIGCGDFTLFGDDEEGPCEGDPCADITNAVSGSCEAAGTDDFTCDCQSGFTWAEATNTCADDPCDPDPCEGIENALADTCEAVGTSDYTCQCETGFVWDEGGNACADDPCDPDPCAGIENATAGTCAAAGTDDFTCGCASGFSWNAATNQCVAGSEGSCGELLACLAGCSVSDFTCQSLCLDAATACDCAGTDPAVVLAGCGAQCLGDCLTDPYSEACSRCLLDCVAESCL